MIVFDVRSLAEKRGIKNAYQLRLFLMERIPGRKFEGPTAGRLFNANEKKWLEKDTIDFLCRAFDCEPGDFIKRIPDKKGGKK